MAYRGRGRGNGGLRHGGRPGGPQLPSTLRDEVDAKYGGPSRSPTHPGARKAMRKAVRHPSRATQPLPDSRPIRQSPHKGGDNSELAWQAESSNKASSSKSVENLRVAAVPAKKKRKEITLPDEVDSDTENAEIEWLEYMLRKDTKGKGKAVEEGDDLEDGLDDLLDMADLIGPGGRGLKRKDMAGSDLSDDEPDDGNSEADKDDPGIHLADSSSNEEDSSQDSESASHSVGDNDDEVDGTEDGHESDSEIEVQGDDNLSKGDTDDDEAEADTLASIPDTRTSPPSKAADGQSVPSKYVPPHLRAAQLEAKAKSDIVKTEELRKLERKAQGLLNKLSEANIDSILGELEGLFRDHARHDVTTLLTSLIIQTVSSRSNLLASFVTLYAALVAALHRVIGVEFAAHFVHALVLRHQETSSSSVGTKTKLQETIYETPDEDKEALNLLTLLAELYNVGVIGPGLIYDFIRGILTRVEDDDVLSEKGTEGLLKLLRTSGQQLRHDDPASLKDIVNLVSERTKGKEKNMNARARFMIETLTNLKNGKLKTLPGADLDAVNRMKKFLGSLGRKRRLLASEPLRVSLKDLLAADTRGKWWLVGAGWAGNPLAELEAARPKAMPAASTMSRVKEEEETLLELARKQGMNTDVRRGIFVALMTSEDYMHACERMSTMKLTEVQQRECVRVSVHCASLEKRYNPYYTLVLNQLCTTSHSHRFTFQYALWDFLRSLEEGELGKEGKRRAENLAKTVAFLIGRQTVDITVLKAIEFPPAALTRSFLYAAISALLVATQSSSPLLRLPRTYKLPADLDKVAINEVFEKCLVNHDLSSGLRFIMDGIKGSEGEGVEADVVKAGVRIAKEVLGRAV